ncbi:GTP-binding protein 8 [Trichonephila clavipes]|nr:GTP-binding protein 8 [Trichonephila clavipes]
MYSRSHRCIAMECDYFEGQLKHYLEIPVLEKDNIFSPDVETIFAAQELFIPNRFHSIKFITSGIGPEKFPNHDLPEVILMGRSNAGKSSLLKAIFRNVPSLLIRTSKKPGHTKTAQFFQIGSKLCIVDMPGYGFNQPEWIEDVLESCIKRKTCVRTFLLIDGKVGVLESDEVAIDMLESFKAPYAIVMTKIDKTADSRLLRNILHLKNVKKSSVYCYAQPFMISSHTYEGLGNLLAFIGHITGNLELRNTKSISS